MIEMETKIHMQICTTKKKKTKSQYQVKKKGQVKTAKEVMITTVITRIEKCLNLTGVVNYPNTDTDPGID